MADFIWITDLHLRSASKVRTGDFLADVKAKLQFTVDYANAHDATILIGGDVFDKPSVPDIVKNTLAPVLLGAKHTPIAIRGNHDELYSSEEYMDKTSYQTWVSHRVIRAVDHETIDLGDVIITNELPIIQRGKPQIVMFHGFLNQEDGRNTFRFQDISSGVTDKVYICLGHDHVVYDPLQFQENIKVFRTGSFTRQTREEASLRNPQLMHIKVTDNRLVYKMVDIKCRPAEEIFTTKLTEVTKAQQHDTYDAIIKQIRDANQANLTFQQALEQVAPEDVCNYANKLLTESKLNAQHEKSNL